MQNKILALNLLSALLSAMSAAAALLVMIGIEDEQHLMVKISIMAGSFLASLVVDQVRRRLASR